jgi:dihydroorotase
MQKKLLKNGEIASSEGVFKKDILIEDGKIIGILDEGEKIQDDVEVIECEGKLILPGLIDPHVHFRVPGAEYKEDWESGSKAAVAGGITSVCDMPNNDPPTVSVKALDEKRKLISGRSYVNYGLYIGYDGGNIDEVIKAKNVPGVKVYVADSTGKMGVDKGALETLFEKSNRLIVAHAEDEACIEKNSEEFLAEFEGREVDPAVHSKIRSLEAALEAVKYVCELAKEHSVRLHIAHVSTEEEVEVISEYKKYGVTCEVTPHHLHLTEDDYEISRNFIKSNPPVRSRSDVFALWKFLKMGVIDIIDTDHAPHTVEEKEGAYLEVPSGIPGVETLLPLFLNTVNNEGLSISELVTFCCERPAEIFKISGKGFIKERFDADLVVVDMDIEKEVRREELFTKAGWSPYEGLNLMGWPVMTFVGGEIVFKEGEIVGEPRGKELVFSV